MRQISGLCVFIIILGCSSGNKQNSGDQSMVASDTASNVLVDLNRIIDKDQTNNNAFYNRAVYYLENEDYNNAFKDITTALELDSTRSDYYVCQADAYIGLGKLKPGIEALEKAVELDDQNIDAYLKLAEISIVFRDYKNALNYIDKSLKLDELESKGYFLRGAVLLETGDTIRSIRNFQKAIDYNQQYFEANLQLGLIFSEKKNDLAIDYLNNALNIDPDNIESLYYLAMFYQNTERYEKAIQVYHSIVAKDGRFFYGYYNIGYINLVYLKNFEEAIDYFNKAIEINPEYADAYYNRGFAYELLKDVEKSRADYQKTLEINSNYSFAIEGLNRIDKYLQAKQE
ncbi:MAG: tetratricopeptide repeat protein [Bacteroidales bacterium]|nr:tetratricopeptide repeat protein [Bacteroidales bacterium]